MNKRVITLVSVAVIPAMFLASVSEWAIGRLLPYGPSHNLAVKTIDVVATALALPVRLYAFLWGVIVERVLWLFSKRNTAR